jgi:sugar/nucleoside kinase (ribokinase family)
VESVFVALQQADVFFANRDEVEKLTGKSDPFEGARRLLESGPEVIALHLGKSGSAVVTPEVTFKADPHDVEVVNPTGTGDTFNAAFVYGLVKGWDLQKVVDFAVASDGLVKGWDLQKVVDFAVASAEVHIQRKDRSFPTLRKVECFVDEICRTAT